MWDKWIWLFPHVLADVLFLCLFREGNNRAGNRPQKQLAADAIRTWVLTCWYEVLHSAVKSKQTSCGQNNDPTNLRAFSFWRGTYPRALFAGDRTHQSLSVRGAEACWAEAFSWGQGRLVAYFSSGHRTYILRHVGSGLANASCLLSAKHVCRHDHQYIWRVCSTFCKNRMTMHPFTPLPAPQRPYENNE
jgi:hypothetical protein